MAKKLIYATVVVGTPRLAELHRLLELTVAFDGSESAAYRRELLDDMRDKAVGMVEEVLSDE